MIPPPLGTWQGSHSASRCLSLTRRVPSSDLEREDRSQRERRQESKKPIRKRGAEDGGRVGRFKRNPYLICGPLRWRTARRTGRRRCQNLSPSKSPSFGLSPSSRIYLLPSPPPPPPWRVCPLLFRSGLPGARKNSAIGSL